MTIRVRSLIIGVVQLIAFSFASFMLVMTLFHAAVLGFPVLGFLWTFFGFSVFSMITNVKVSLGRQIVMAFLNLLALAGAIALLLSAVPELGNPAARAVIITTLAVTAILYVLFLVHLVKRYWKDVLAEVKRLFVKRAT